MCNNMYDKTDIVGQRIKALRKKRGISQAELAQKIGVTKETIYRYENSIQIPPLRAIIRFALYFGTSLDSLVGLDNREFVDVSHLTDKQIDALRECLNVYPFDYRTL